MLRLRFCELNLNLYKFPPRLAAISSERTSGRKVGDQLLGGQISDVAKRFRTCRTRRCSCCGRQSDLAVVADQVAARALEDFDTRIWNLEAHLALEVVRDDRESDGFCGWVGRGVGHRWRWSLSAEIKQKYLFTSNFRKMTRRIIQSSNN